MSGDMTARISRMRTALRDADALLLALSVVIDTSPMACFFPATSGAMKDDIERVRNQIHEAVAIRRPR